MKKVKLLSFLVLAIPILGLSLAGCRKKGIESPEKDDSGDIQTFEEYITINEYNKLHSENVKVLKAFSESVHGKARKLTSGIQKKPVHIAFIYPGQQISDYWRRSLKSFKARMDEIGIQYRVDEIFTRAGTLDIEKQQEELKTALEKNVDYLVFTMNVMQHKKLIERVITDGRPKLILQNITTPLREWEGKQPFLYVGFDHLLGAEILARYFIERTGGEGNYAVLYFSEGYVSDMRGETFIDYLKKNSNLNHVSAFYTDGQREKARAAVLDILNKTEDLKFIYTCSTDVAFGAIDALEETGNIGKIAVNGWGGGSSELSSILNGDMDVTVMRNNDDNGVAMAEAIHLDLEGEGEKVPTVYSGEFNLVEKGIDPKALEGLKLKAFRYSGME